MPSPPGRSSARRLVDCLRVTDDALVGAVAAALEEHLGAWVVDDLGFAATFLDRAGPRERLIRAGLDAVAEPPRGAVLAALQERSRSTRAPAAR